MPYPYLLTGKRKKVPNCFIVSSKRLERRRQFVRLKLNDRRTRRLELIPQTRLREMVKSHKNYLQSRRGQNYVI